MKKIYSYSLSAAFVAALLSVSSVANAQENSEVTVKDATVATFEDLTLEPERHWAGPADNAVEVEGAWGSKNMVGTFKSGAYEFVNSFTPKWSSWTGCSYSNMTATSFADYTLTSGIQLQVMVLLVQPIMASSMVVVLQTSRWKLSRWLMVMLKAELSRV